MAALDDLELLVTPPSSAFKGGCDERDVVRAFGTAVPPDYLELLDTYGAGSFCSLLTPLAPGSGGSALDDLVKETLADVRALDYPLPGFPQVEYLPCAFFVDGEEVYWQCSGSPEAWPVWLVSPGGGDAELAGHSLTQFIVDWIRGELDGSVASGLPDVRELPAPFFEISIPREILEIRLNGRLSVAEIEGVLETVFSGVSCRYSLPESASPRFGEQAYFDAEDGQVLIYSRGTIEASHITCQVPPSLLASARSRLRRAFGV